MKIALKIIIIYFQNVNELFSREKKTIQNHVTFDFRYWIHAQMFYEHKYHSIDYLLDISIDVSIYKFFYKTSLTQDIEEIDFFVDVWWKQLVINELMRMFIT